MTHKVCGLCKTEFETKANKKKYCSDECKRQATNLQQKEKHRKKKLSKVANLIKCEICGDKFKALSGHLKRTHNLTTKEYKEKYNKETLSKEVLHKLSENITGEKNPGYKHNGKFSKFSKKFIHGYDEEWAKQQHQNFKKNKKENPHLFPNRIEYWIEKCDGDLEKAEEAYSNFQRKDLDYFIKRYGKEEGTNRYKQKTEKWMTTLRNKPLEEKQRINRLKCWKGGARSKIEEEIYTELSKVTDINQYGSVGEYTVDFISNNKIIEFYGDYWHMNPSIYKKDFKNPSTKLVAKDKWKLDKDRIKYIKENGYDVLIVWENDYRNNSQKTISKCLEFLDE